MLNLLEALRAFIISIGKGRALLAERICAYEECSLGGKLTAAAALESTGYSSLSTLFVGLDSD